MKMLCPECMTELTASDGKNARCPVHGGVFEILYQRPERAAVPTPTPPDVAAALPPAAGAPPVSLSTETTPVALPPPPPALPPVSRFANVRCVQHPNVQAVVQCDSCGAYMCATCDFPIAGGLHVCPACAVSSQTKLGSHRKGSLYWSLGLATVATLGTIVTFGSLAMNPVRTAAAEQAAGLAMMFFVLLPAIIGFGLGFGSMDKRYRTPVSLWVATIWNALIAGGFILLMIIGAMK